MYKAALLFLITTSIASASPVFVEFNMEQAEFSDGLHWYGDKDSSNYLPFYLEIEDTKDCGRAKPQQLHCPLLIKNNVFEFETKNGRYLSQTKEAEARLNKINKESNLRINDNLTVEQLANTYKQVYREVSAVFKFSDGLFGNVEAEAIVKIRDANTGELMLTKGFGQDDRFIHSFDAIIDKIIALVSNSNYVKATAIQGSKIYLNKGRLSGFKVGDKITIKDPRGHEMQPFLYLEIKNIKDKSSTGEVLAFLDTPRARSFHKVTKTNYYKLDKYNLIGVKVNE